MVISVREITNGGETFPRYTITRPANHPAMSGRRNVYYSLPAVQSAIAHWDGPIRVRVAK